MTVRQHTLRKNIPALFIALSGDNQTHFTTPATFISDRGDTVAKLFTQVVHICDPYYFLGREMFAHDGVKLPANADKAKSSIRAD
jgi:hypothetical protein